MISALYLMWPTLDSELCHIFSYCEGFARSDSTAYALVCQRVPNDPDASSRYFSAPAFIASADFWKVSAFCVSCNSRSR